MLIQIYILRKETNKHFKTNILWIVTLDLKNGTRYTKEWNTRQMNQHPAKTEIIQKYSTQIVQKKSTPLVQLIKLNCRLKKGGTRPNSPYTHRTQAGKKRQNIKSFLAGQQLRSIQAFPRFPLFWFPRQKAPKSGFDIPKLEYGDCFSRSVQHAPKLSTLSQMQKFIFSPDWMTMV